MMMIKGKRSKRPRPSSPLALTMATTSSSSTEFSATLSSSPSNSLDYTNEEQEEEDLAKCLILLAKGDLDQKSTNPYQCKTCNKCFHSFQALGGHRASHKNKPNKPIITLEEKKEDNGSLISLEISTRVVTTTSAQNNKSRVHECSICGAEFASGQALGGHMRRHRPIVPPTSNRGDGGEPLEVKRPRSMLALDLNLPAPEDESSKFIPFVATKEQVIVFSASPLVDCQY